MEGSFKPLKGRDLFINEDIAKIPCSIVESLVIQTTSLEEKFALEKATSLLKESLILT